MTKRFQIDDEGDISEFDSNGKWVDCWMYANGKHWEGLCNELNHLNDENEQLRIEKGNVQTKHSYELMKKLECKSKLIDLKKENEQLKKETQQVKDILKEYDDFEFFVDGAIAIGFIERIALAVEMELEE